MNVTIEKGETTAVIPILMIGGLAILLVLFGALAWIHGGGIM